MRIRQVTRLIAFDETVPVLPQTIAFDAKWKAHTTWRDMSIALLKKLIIG
jgi:hypothetical protein